MIKETDYKYTAILFFMTIVMIVLFGQIDYTEQPYSSWDLAAYREMASASPGINPDIPQPFAYRLLGPFLVGLLPIPDSIAFYALAITFSFILVFLFYYFLLQLGISRVVSTVTVLLFIFNKY